MLRRKAREYALKILYMIDMREDTNSTFLENFEENEKVKKFADEIIKGVIENMKEIDEIISKVSLNWDIKRMSYIDRNILRIATYEIVFREDIPSIVSINEAIEISKKYGDEDSPKFINGILHKIKEIYENNKKEKKGDENEI
ncbi:MAG TPA: transcription antitermination factor NusB [bacterium]|nr:transcription antitermination factor NusB [bacterium]HOM27252.1 transcription antitermination factor NusB [bacterium]